MDAVRVWLDDPRGPAAFLVAIAVITVVALVMQRTRSRQRLRAVGTSAQRPWPVDGASTLVVPAPAGVPDLESAPATTTVLPVSPVSPVPAQPVPAQPVPAQPVPAQRSPAQDAPAPTDRSAPIGTILLVGTPGGPVMAARPAELLGVEPGLHVRVRRADLDPHALVAALPDEAAILLDDLTAAPTDSSRNMRFRRAVDAARPVLACAVMLAGPTGTAPVVTIGTLAVPPLLGADPRLAALLARAVATGARSGDRRDFATALLASVRSRPISHLVGLDALAVDDPWVTAHRAELGRRYGSLLGTPATAS
jgi:hypothetical protein